MSITRTSGVGEGEGVIVVVAVGIGVSVGNCVAVGFAASVCAIVLLIASAEGVDGAHAARITIKTKIKFVKFVKANVGNQYPSNINTF
jgi:hypothetical protein